MSTNDPDQIRAEIDRTREQVATDIDVLSEKVSPTAAMQRQGEKLKTMASDAKDAIFGSAEDTAHRVEGMGTAAGESARGMAHSARDAVENAPQMMREKARGNPLAVGVIGFGAGLLIASLIPSSRAEQNLAARVKDSDEMAAAKETLSEAAHGLMDSAKESARSMADQAKEGMDVVREEGMSAAQDVRSSAQDAAEHTKDAAM